MEIEEKGWIGNKDRGWVFNFFNVEAQVLLILISWTHFDLFNNLFHYIVL